MDKETLETIRETNNIKNKQKQKKQINSCELKNVSFAVIQLKIHCLIQVLIFAKHSHWCYLLQKTRDDYGNFILFKAMALNLFEI